MPVLILLRSLIFRNENGRTSQSVSLFLFNASLALLSSSTSLSISHTENIVGLDAAVEPAVSRDGIPELLSLVLWLLNAVEHSEGIFI